MLLQTEISESVRQRIVSFTPAGEEDAADDAIHVPTLQIVAQHFAFVGTGDVVVLGYDPQSGGERLVLVSRAGTVLAVPLEGSRELVVHLRDLASTLPLSGPAL